MLHLSQLWGSSECSKATKWKWSHRKPRLPHRSTWDWAGETISKQVSVILGKIKDVEYQC